MARRFNVGGGDVSPTESPRNWEHEANDSWPGQRRDAAIHWAAMGWQDVAAGIIIAGAVSVWLASLGLK